METTELIDTLLKSRDAKELQTAFAAMTDAAEIWRPLMHQLTTDALARPAEILADIHERQRLALSWLFLAMQHDREALPLILELCRTAAFNELITEEDWLLRELPKVVGSMMQADEMPLLSDWIAAPETPAKLRDQLMMTILFRWVGGLEPAEAVAAAVKKLLSGNWCDRDNAHLRMALIITAISVNDPSLKPQILAFYQKSGSALKKILEERSIEGFFALGPEKMLSLLHDNYDGQYTDSAVEIDKMLNPPTEDPRKLVPREFGKPLVRDTPKINRNDTCPCGSGKKYKKCCGK